MNDETTIIEFTSRAPTEVGFRFMRDGEMRYVAFHADMNNLNLPRLLREAAVYVDSFTNPQ